MGDDMVEPVFKSDPGFPRALPPKPKRRKPSPQQQRKRQADQHYAMQRLRCLQKAEHRCQVRTASCTGWATHVHHIAGRRIPDPHRLSNLVACCASCHNMSADSIHANRGGWAYEAGWLVRPSTVTEVSG